MDFHRKLKSYRAIKIDRFPTTSKTTDQEDIFMNICSYTFEEYVERVRAFHGFAAPGVLIGGFMVDAACRSLPEKTLDKIL